MIERETAKMRREPSADDRPCDYCGVPMLGIMKVSDVGGCTKRKVCASCCGIHQVDQMGKPKIKVIR